MTTVLNVDDNAATRYARTRVLRQAGYDVVEGGTGEDALQLVKSAKPHLVLMDVRLPDMSGIDVCRHIKADPETMRTPVVQISATFVTEQDQLLGLEGGAEVYLTEPVEPSELITVVRTLLRLRSAEKTLSEAETRWRRLFGANVIGIMIVDGLRVLEANNAFLDVVGLPRAVFQNEPIDLRAVTPEEFRALDEAAQVEMRTTGAFSTYEKEFVRRDGVRVRALVGGTRLSADTTRWMGFVLDISERRKAEAERERLLVREQDARREAERATRIRDEFLANLSHELRTPMSTITGWLHLLSSGRLGKEESQHAIEAIERATRAQNQLIEDLLDVSRIVAGKLDLQRERVVLGKLLEASVESVTMSARTKGVTISLEPLDETIAVRGDRQRLQQVFWNLLSNAVKFTPQGGYVSVSVHVEPELVRVNVSDTGEGIAAEFLPYVFDRFRQADGSTSRRHGGMGLGLAIVRHVVDLHGGNVVATSEGEGRGAEFRVELPRANEAAAQIVPDTGPSTPAYGDAPLRGIAVLLVDDDADARDVARAILGEAGAECWSVDSAAEALAVLDDWKPAVVVCDIGMSGIDGYGFIQRLRARSARRGGMLPALALTAFARKEDRERALSTGYDTHVTKPIDPHELVEAIVKLASRSGVQTAAHDR